MKKPIIVGISIIACVALCAVVWQGSAKVENLPVKPLKAAVRAEIEARSEETPHIFISDNMAAPETKNVAEIEPQITEVTAEEKTETPAPVPTAAPAVPKPQAVSKSAPASTEAKPGDRTVIDGEPHVWIPGFGWILDEGGGIVAEDMYENGHKIGIMGSDGSALSSTPPQAYAEPEITGDVIYAPIQPPVTKDSTPPAYKPNGEPYTP